jgi:hypothetical protein
MQMLASIERESYNWNQPVRGRADRDVALFFSREEAKSAMSHWLKKRPVVMLVVGLTAGLLVGVGMMVGTLATLGHSSSAQGETPEIILNASASHSGKSFAMATGWIDNEIEGLFTLDYLTGDLKCWVMNPRNPAQGWTGGFQHNVIADLGVQQGKEPSYVMVTGQANFLRGGAQTTPASSVLYVADANTGNFAAYTIYWNQTMGRTGALQTGPFQVIAKGKARTLEIRD